MKELSLNILDIVENSVNASAKNIDIVIEESAREDTLVIKINDDGRGMDESVLKSVRDPFMTTKSSKKVGLGVSLLNASAQMCDGRLDVASSPGKGTNICAVFKNSHLDRPPLGDISGTLVAVMAMHPGINISYCHKINDKIFAVNTSSLRELMSPLPLNNPAVLKGIEEYIKSNLENLKEG
ncbi:MAG: Sporulation kinase A [Elusimicrobia bacterium ADurb.Bin231]|nr:MAG: Sporulation kinase A [Elusimicrobia bacterium ADurb.Bin231]